MNFSEQPNVKLGNCGEDIAEAMNEALRSLHDVLHKGEKSCPIDFLFANDRGKIVEIGEVKTRRKGAFFLNGKVACYGVGLDFFANKYKPLADATAGDVDFKLYFVDVAAGKIYYDSLSELLKPYEEGGIKFPAQVKKPWQGKEVWYLNFAREQFHFCRAIFSDGLAELRELARYADSDEELEDSWNGHISNYDIVKLIRENHVECARAAKKSAPQAEVQQVEAVKVEPVKVEAPKVEVPAPVNFSYQDVLKSRVVGLSFDDYGFGQVALF